MHKAWTEGVDEGVELDMEFILVNTNMGLSLLLLTPSISQFQQPAERQLEARQQGCGVGLVGGDDELLVAVGGEEADGHRSREAVDDPVLFHADFPVLGPLGDVISLLVDFSLRDQLDDDGGWFVRTRQMPQARPDHAIGPAAVLLRLDGLLADRGVERRTLRMRLLVVAEPSAQLFVRITFVKGGNWGHDEYLVDQLVPPAFHESSPVELLGGQQHPCRSGPEAKSAGFCLRRCLGHDGPRLAAVLEALERQLERFSDALHAPRLSPPPLPPPRGGKDGAPLRKGGKVGGVWSFSPLAKGGYRGVLRVPLRCARFGIQAIENRSSAVCSRIAYSDQKRLWCSYL